jgi:hypothetical protein
VRKLLIGALTGVVVLAVAAVAMAVTTTTYEQTYTTKKKNTSTGTAFKTTSSADQGDNPENNDQPKSTRQFNITFPAGTKVNTTTVPQCKGVQEDADTPCPKNTQVGSGSAVVKLPLAGINDVNATVTAYNRKNGLILYVNPQGANPVYLYPKFKGLKLKTAVPPTCIPPASNQGGQCKKSDGSQGQEAVLTSFDLKVKAFKKGKKTYIKTPPKCPKSGAWTFKAQVVYSDNSTVNRTAKSKCKK